MRSITAGWRHSLAVTADGAFYAWGRGCSGQLGLGGSSDSCVALPLPCSRARDSSRDMVSGSQRPCQGSKAMPNLQAFQLKDIQRAQLMSQ